MTRRPFLRAALLAGLAACSPMDPPEPSNPRPQVRSYAGGAKTCVVLDDTQLRCWGRNDDGRLGFGLSETHLGDDEPASTVPLLDLGATIVSVTPTTSLACLMLESGTAHCWGGAKGLAFAWEGWLGDDETLLDGPALDFGNDRLAQISVGTSHTCAVLDEGGVKCWGDGAYGATGYASTQDIRGVDPKDLPLVEVGGPVRLVAAGYHFTCAVMRDGSLRCWGGNGFGKLGLSLDVDENFQTIHIGDDEVPASVGPIDLAGGPVVQVAVQGRQICALHQEGTVSCWGETGPWLGYGKAIDGVGDAYGDDEHPSELGVVDVGAKVVQVVVGDAFTCARLEDGGVKCWGASDAGQLGYGNTNYVGYEQTPAEVGTVDLGGPAIDIAAGWQHTCAVLDNFELRCWGRADFGVLGYGDGEHIGDDETPAQAGPVPYKQ